MTTAFDPLDPTESTVLTFDFTAGLGAGETLLGPATFQVTVDYGVDPSASAIMKNNAIVGSTVLLAVSGCLANTDYHFHVQCMTSNPYKILNDAGVLPCRIA